MQDIFIALLFAVIGVIALVWLYHTIHEVIMLALLQFALQPLAEHWHLHKVIRHYRRKDNDNG